MTAIPIYQPYGAVVRIEGAVVDTLIGGITDQNIDGNTQIDAEVTAGQDTPQHSQITQISGRGQFVGFDVGKTLQAIGLAGACLDGGVAPADPGFALYQLQLQTCGSLATGAVHRRLIMPNGYIVPRSLSVGHRTNAQLTTEVLGIWDGTNDQIIPVGSVAAPTGLEDLHRYTLGAIQVGGITIQGNLSLDVDFGVDVQTDSGDSDAQDTNIQVISKQPMITVSTRDVTKFAASGAIPLSGLRATHANSSFILRRRLNGTAGFMAGADHIRVTFDGLVTVTQPWRASSNQRGEMSIQIKCLDDGTNYPLIAAYTHTLV